MHLRGILRPNGKNVRSRNFVPRPLRTEIFRNISSRLGMPRHRRFGNPALVGGSESPGGVRIIFLEGRRRKHHLPVPLLPTAASMLDIVYRNTAYARSAPAMQGIPLYGIVPRNQGPPGILLFGELSLSGQILQRRKIAQKCRFVVASRRLPACMRNHRGQRAMLVSSAGPNPARAAAAALSSPRPFLPKPSALLQAGPRRPCRPAGRPCAPAPC